MFSGAGIRPHSHWNLGDFFPTFEKNPNLHLFFEDWDFHSFSQHSHKLHGDVLLQFNDNSMCNSYFCFD